MNCSFSIVGWVGFAKDVLIFLKVDERERERDEHIKKRFVFL